MQQQESEETSLVYCESCKIFVNISNLLSHSCFNCTIINNDTNHEVVDKPQQHEEVETVEELLISLVQLRPALWDHLIALKNRSKNIKDDLWVEIFTAMGQIISLEEIKKKWRNLQRQIHKVLSVPPPSVNINPSSLYEGNAACVAIAEILNKLPQRNKAKLEIELLRLVYDTYDQYISDSGCSNC
ncbi:hypothetical protein NQ314_007012 [Rhamnusium bicolor]|uniref:MADF domain-containing protein n=1 Tax=Rhamnusium bicolor TaxID=1586634 RepID=A0AAV8YT00_9CUCU|nr:hypothetical protein NQ314_007012 [Rhamnusium bicolor]